MKKTIETEYTRRIHPAGSVGQRNVCNIANYFTDRHGDIISEYSHSDSAFYNNTSQLEYLIIHKLLYCSAQGEIPTSAMRGELPRL